MLEPGEVATARGRSGPRVQRDAREDMVGQPGRQPEVAARHARAGQARGERVLQVRPGEAIRRALLAQALDELADRLPLHALRAGEPELAPEVDQHLVAPRRHALEELVDRLRRVELVEPHPRLQGEHELERVARVDGTIRQVSGE